MNPKFLNPILACALVTTMFASVPAAPASLADAETILHTTTDELMAIIYEKPADGRLLTERARPVLEKYFDFGLLTRRAVGPGWRQFKPEQQQRITQLLTSVVIRSYCSHFDTSIRSRVTYASPLNLASDRCELPATIIYEGKNISVAYRAELLPEGWRFYDVIAEGVSLVANYRAQFIELSQHGGADAIIHALEENLAANPPV